MPRRRGTEMFFHDALPNESPDLGVWAEFLDPEDVVELTQLTKELREAKAARHAARVARDEMRIRTLKLEGMPPAGTKEYAREYYRRKKAGTLGGPSPRPEPGGVRPAPAPQPRPAPSRPAGSPPPRDAAYLDEHEAFAKSVGWKSVSYGARNLSRWDKVAALSAASQGMLDMKKHYDVPQDVHLVIGGLRGGTLGRYSPDRKIVQLAAGHGRGIGTEISSSQQLRLGSTGFHASDHALATVHHELGHAAHAAGVGSPSAFMRMAYGGWRGRGSYLAGNVSHYAQTNPLEFVAEYISGKQAGRTYTPEVDGMYELFNGPKRRG